MDENGVTHLNNTADGKSKTRSKADEKEFGQFETKGKKRSCQLIKYQLI